jgi:hypothetical protein
MANERPTIGIIGGIGDLGSGVARFDGPLCLCISNLRRKTLLAPVLGRSDESNACGFALWLPKTPSEKDWCEEMRFFRPSLVRLVPGPWC